MADRFFIEAPLLTDQADLSGDQAHHIGNVMRAKIGDSLVLFDDRGNEYITEITAKTKKTVTVVKRSQRRPERRLSRSVTVVTALPKGDRQKFLMEKLVELGVDCVVPLTTSRSVAQINEKVIRRLEKQIIEATKQCRRSYLMRIAPSKTIAAVTEMPNDLDEADGTEFLIAHPYTESMIWDVQSKLLAAKSICWLVGPEGGFSEVEFSNLTDCGWTPTSLGQMILRVETAAIAVAAATAMIKPV